MIEEEYYRQILRGAPRDEEFIEILATYEYFHPRRSGRTTRIIDFSVQKLFIERELRFMDHYPKQEGRKHAWRIFLDRLHYEHFRQGLKEVFHINHNQFYIRFKKDGER